MNNLCQVEDMGEFEGIEELSSKETKDVAGGGIFFTAFAVIALVKYVKVVTVVATHMATNDALNRGRSSGGGGSRRRGTNGRRPGSSDIRLKQAIKLEGRLDDRGIDVYSWEYKDAPGERFVGVMAQDLLARDDLSHAVFTFDEGPLAGFYGVYYGDIGLQMLPVEAWDGDIASLMEKELVAA